MKFKEEKLSEKIISSLEEIFGVKSVEKTFNLNFKKGYINVSISKDKLDAIARKIPKLDFKDTYLYHENYFEQLLSVNGPDLYFIMYFHKPLIKYDYKNIIKYEISKPSVEYVLMSILALFYDQSEDCPSLFLENYLNKKKSKKESCKHVIKHKMDLTNIKDLNKVREAFKNENEDIEFNLTFENIIEELEFKNIRTLKVISNNELSTENFHELANSLRFKVNYQTQDIVIKEFQYIQPIEGIIKRFEMNEIEIQSTICNEELLHYYEQALSTSDPLLKFLSFYHIIEYFHEIITLENLIDEIKDYKEVSYENGEINTRLYQIIRKTCQKEKYKLREVLKRFLDKDQLIKNLQMHENNYYTYLKSNNVEFADAKHLNEEDFFGTLTERIYRVRNALVHRKEGDKSKYLIFSKEHENELIRELPLIQIVAEEIIIKNSNEFNPNKLN